MNRLCELAVLAALAMVLLLAAAQAVPAASTGVCSTAEAHDTQCGPSAAAR